MNKLVLGHFGKPITIECYEGLPPWLHVYIGDLERKLRSTVETRKKGPGRYRVYLEYYAREKTMFTGIWLQRDIEIYGPGPRCHMIGFVEVKGEEKKP